jgi:hypothetical protein
MSHGARSSAECGTENVGFTYPTATVIRFSDVIEQRGQSQLEHVAGPDDGYDG